MESLVLYHFHLDFIQVKIIFGFIDVQYLQNVVLSFEKGLNGQNQSKTDFHHPLLKPLLSQKVPIAPAGRGDFPAYSFNAIWKTLVCFTFQSRSLEIIFTHSSVWLWTVTFNTPKNEISLKLLSIIGNGFLILSRWAFSGLPTVGGAFLAHPSLKSATHILQWWNLAQLYLT